MFIDDDEWFVETEPIVRFFQSGEHRQYGGANYLVRNFADKAGHLWADVWVSRLIKLTPRTRFVSPIHEYLTPAPKKYIGLEAIVYHYGYAYDTQEEARQHFERNSGLVLEMIEREPGETRWRNQMIKEYASIHEWDEMYRFADECMTFFRDRRRVDADNAWGGFYATKIVALNHKDDYENAYVLCEQALEDQRINELARAFISLRRGDCGMHLGKYEEAEASIKEYLKCKQYYVGKEHLLMKQKCVPFAENAFDPVQVNQAYSILICAGLKQGKTSYMKQYWDELEYDQDHVYLYELMMECLIEAMATLDDDQMFVTVLRTMYGHEVLWTRLSVGLLKWVMEEREGSLHLLALLQKAEIDDSFLRVYYLRNRICHFPPDKTDEELQTLLEKYVSRAETYFKETYGEQIGYGLSGEDDLPPDCRAVLLLREMFGKKHLEEQLRLVRQVVEAYPPLGETMKRYVRVLQKNEVQKTDPQTTFKLQLMAQQIMKQLPILLEAGQTQEARDIVKQLRVMLPEDEQLRNLEKQIS